MALCPGVVGPTQTRLNSDKGGKDMKFGEERLERLFKNIHAVVNITKINFVKYSAY